MMVMIWGTARRLYPDDESVAFCAALATALCAPVAIWGLQGSDVAFTACWLAGAVYLLAGRNPAGTRTLAVLVVGLWIRPDAALFYVPLLVCAAISGGRAGRTLLIGAIALAATLRSPFFAFDDHTLARLAWPDGAAGPALPRRFRPGVRLRSRRFA